MNPLRFFRRVTCEAPGYLGDMVGQGGYPYQVICLADVVFERWLDTVYGEG